MFGNKMDKIAKLADKNDAVKLLGMLNDKDEKVVLAAIDALGRWCTTTTRMFAPMPCWRWARWVCRRPVPSCCISWRPNRAPRCVRPWIRL